MTWDMRAYSGLRPDPFVAWLDAHGLLHPGCAWEATQDVNGVPIYRRLGSDVGLAWPAERIPGPLVVRPKREALLP